MKYNRVLAIDPSGAFEEGKGTTGWINFIDNKPVYGTSICAVDYTSPYLYWREHVTLIDNLSWGTGSFAVVIEDYLLYSGEAQSQINSRFETCQLIGIIKYFCDDHNIPIFTQRASEVKQRWANNILVHKGYLRHVGRQLFMGDILTNDHIRDALRHGVHFTTFYNN